MVGSASRADAGSHTGIEIQHPIRSERGPSRQRRTCQEERDAYEDSGGAHDRGEPTERGLVWHLTAHASADPGSPAR
jgi:hypothetical protein